MKRGLLIFKMCVVLKVLFLDAYAQTNIKDKVYFYGVGFGLVSPTGIDQSLANDNMINIGNAKLFTGLEKPISTKQSVLLSLEGNFYSLFFNGFIDQKNRLIPTFDSIRYSTLNNLTVDIPLLYRVYSSEDHTGNFFQLGIRAGYNFYNKHTIHLQGSEHTQSLNNISGLIYGIEAGFGRKFTEGKATWGLNIGYRLNPYFSNSGSTQMRLLQVSLNIGRNI